AHDEDTNGLDSLIDYTVPADGQYILQIHDLRYQGGGDFTYRIKAGEIPYVDVIYPLGGKRGQEISLELVGRNLDKPKMSMTLDGPMGKRDVLQRNDDAMGADARIEMKFEKDKDYFLHITDLLGRGGSNFPYRLQITPVVPEQPDFEVVFLPEMPRVARGSKMKLWCQVK